MNDIKKNLCESCVNKFPTCDAKNIVRGIDLNPSAGKVEADMVVKCDAYQMSVRIIQLLAGWGGILLGLGSDGITYTIGHNGCWELHIPPLGVKQITSNEERAKK